MNHVILDAGMIRPTVYLILDTHFGYDRHVLAGIHRYAGESNWDLRIDNVWRQTLNPPSDTAVHGVIGRVSSYDLRRPLIERGVPCVDITGDVAEQVSTACADERGIATVAADHFHERGLHRTAFFGPRQSWAMRRARAWEQQVLERHWPRPSSFLFRVDPLQRRARAQQEHQRALRWLTKLPLPAAIVCANDEVAVQLLDMIRETRLRVPGDVAVLGCDNDEMICTFARPTLSTVNLSAEHIGYNAATILAAMMQGDRALRVLLQPPRGIVTRQSTLLYDQNVEHVQAALEFIQLHAAQGITAASVVEAIPQSRRALERRFKQVVGRTLHEHILHQRVSLARSLLETTSLKMEVIATRSGFSSGVRLSETFKRLTGQSPSGYRQQAQRK